MKKIAILTGAGISAESGIATFRDSNGLWENYSIEEVATPEAWKRDPDLVTEFYNMRRKQVLEAQPNAAHLYLAELQNDYDVHIVTQNIDDLHERAGSRNILHLHGLITQAKSSGPKQESRYYPIEGWQLAKNDTCDDGYRLRPHVVWFGEDVPNLSKAAQIVSEADILLIIGTSLQVYPAAGLIHAAKPSATIICIDPNADSISLAPNVRSVRSTAVNALQTLKTLLA